MFTFLKTLLGSRDDEAAGEDPAILAAAVEEVIEGTDPRLRMVGGVNKKLRAPVARSLAYARELAAVLPGPFEVGKKTFGSDPQVGAFFASVDHLREVFGNDRSLRTFLKSPEHSSLAECYALLVMQKTERNVLGMETFGDMVRKDVPQTVVSFGNHHVEAAAVSLESSRQDLTERAFDHLVGCALRRLVSLKAHTAELTERQLLLEARLQQRLAKKRGLESLVPGPAIDGAETLEIRRDLADAEEQLRDTSASRATLNDYLSQIQDVLSHPEDQFRLRQATVRMDQMGVKRDPGSPQRASDITLAEVEIGDDRQAVGILIKYSPQELPSRPPSLAPFGP